MLSQTVISNKLIQYLNNRSREYFSAQLSPGYCHGLALLFCYFANIKSLDKFYAMLTKVSTWDERNDKQILAKIEKIKTTPEWQTANKKLQDFELQLSKPSQLSYVDKVNEALSAKFITQAEAQVLLSAVLPDDPDMEKFLGLIETLQRLDKYERILSSGAKLNLIRDANQQSPLYTAPYKDNGEFEDAIIVPKNNLHEVFTHLPENRATILGTGRHIFAVIKEKNKYTLYNSNADEIIPAFNSAIACADFLLSTVYKDLKGSHVPIGMEILAQEQQPTNDYEDFKLFCNVFRRSDYASFVKTRVYDDYSEDSMTPLILSMTANLPNLAVTLVNENIGIDAYDALGFYPIHYAAFKGLTAVVQQLIAKGMNVDQAVTMSNGTLTKVGLSLHDSVRYATPLFFACVANNSEMVKLLLNSGADINKASRGGLNPLMAAVRNGNSELVKLLIDSGARLDSKIDVVDDNEYESKNCVELHPLEFFGALYLPDFDGYNCAMLAAQEKQTKIVLDLLLAGVNGNYTNGYGMSLLHVCVSSEILNQEILSGCMASIDKLAKMSSDSNELISPLWIACFKNNYAMVKFLLENGANPNIKNKFELAPLMQAVASGSLEIVTLLVNSGADISVKDAENNTLLDKAIISGNSHLIEFLLHAGLEPQDQNKLSPGTLSLATALAKSNNQFEALNLILSWMITHNRPIPNDLNLAGNHSLLMFIYIDLSRGKYSDASELCNDLIATLNSYTNPVTPSQFTMYSNEHSPTLKKLSEQLITLTNPTFDSIKEQFLKTFNEGKVTPDETKFLQALSMSIDDCKTKLQFDKCGNVFKL